MNAIDIVIDDLLSKLPSSVRYLEGLDLRGEERENVKNLIKEYKCLYLRYELLNHGVIDSEHVLNSRFGNTDNVIYVRFGL